MAKPRKRHPRLYYAKASPRAVILNIDEYREMLEQSEDLEDLRMLKRMRKEPLKFPKLDDFLKEFHPGV